MENKIIEMLGINNKSYTPQEVYDKINQLFQTSQENKRLRKEIEIYKLDRRLQRSKTPLTEIAMYWDSHLPSGASKQVGWDNVVDLCRKLESESGKIN